ncbi:MAG: hypothetical protein HY926_02710 [Elusimicrobia bacterium]|nr:hypothetical protein [Elusimicrobiota bacterium]
MIIDMSTTVFISAGAAIPPLNSLTLGDAGGSFAPTLWLSTGIAVSGPGGVSRFYAGATLLADTSAQLTFTNLVLAAGSSITYTRPGASGPPPAGSGAFINLRILDTLTVQAGATITAYGLGYPAVGGPQPGATAIYGGGGGGHGAAGGLGGQPGAGGGVGGQSYDALITPGDYGSGGGLGANIRPAAAGGGFILIDAGSATIDGLITVSGADAPAAADWGGGGGAGGAVRLRAAYLYGQGSILAGGGAGGSGALGGGGGGAGGRIAVAVTGPYDTLTSTLTIRPWGGAGGGGPDPGVWGSTGSVHMNPAHWTGGAGPASPNAVFFANWYATAPAAGVTVVFGSSGTTDCFWDLPFTVVMGSVALLAAYPSTVTIANNLAVSGSWTMAGGTVAMTGGLNLFVGGDVAQSGGRFAMPAGTFVLSGNNPQNASFTPDSFFNNFTANAPPAGVGNLNLLSDLAVRGNMGVGLNNTLVLGAGRTLRVGGNWPWVGMGRISADPASQIVADGSAVQIWQTPPNGLGRLRVSNTGGGVSLAAGSWTLGGPGASSELLVDTAAVLSIAGSSLSVSGDWLNYGSVDVSASTVAFISAAADQYIVAGASFNIVAVNKPGRTLSLSTEAVVASSVSVNGGTFDLLSSTITVGGDWLQTPAALVRGGASTAIFRGTRSQRLTLLAGSSFYNLISSASGSAVILSSHLVVANRLEVGGGTLQISSRTVLVLGDVAQGLGSTVVSGGSTVTLAGAAPQSLGAWALDTVVIDNSDPAGVRLSTDLVVGSSFTILSGRAFDAADRRLTMRGSGWQTAGAVYLSSNPAHAVRWDPAGGTLWVAAGSTVNARVTVSTNATVRLLGDLDLRGFGNLLDVQAGASIINAAGGSSITFHDTADLAPSAGVNWTYGGNVGQSWLVFEGTGSARGAAISSNTLGNLMVRLSGATSTFTHPDLALSSHVVVASGVFKPAGNRTLTLKGDFLQTGGTIDYVSAGTGTVRLAGSGPQAQRVSLAAGHALQAFTLAGSTQVTALSDLNIRGDFRVLGGTFAAGANILSVGGAFYAPSSAAFLAQGSTLTLDGGRNIPPATFQSLTYAAGQTFHGLSVEVSSAAFSAGFQADAFTSRVAGSTLAFASGATSTVGDLRLSGSPGGGRIILRPITPAVPWRLAVLAFSSASAVDVSSCDASVGLTVQANDGKSLDSGGNSNWNFKPSLRVLPPGPQQAGTPFGVAVQAVDSSSNPVASAAFPVALTWTELYVSTPPPQSLVNGATVFSNVVLRTAQTTTISPQPDAQAYSVAGTAVAVGPGPLARLQLLLPGESPQPGSFPGKAGQVEVIAAGQPILVRVRGTDPYWNLDPVAPADLVQVSTTAALASNLPQSTALAAGATAFTSVVFLSSASGVTLAASDLSNGAVTGDVSTVFSVFAAQSSSPTLSISIPAYSLVLTLGGAISGTAADTVAVSRVSVAVQRKDSGLFFTWIPPAFGSASPVFSTAAVVPYLGTPVQWSLPFADAALSDQTSYYVLARATNPSSNLTVAESTFTFSTSTLQGGSAADGGGAAVALTSAAYGCQLLVSTVVFTAGPLGISPGGAVAVHWPDGWTRPLSTGAADPPSAPGVLFVGAAGYSIDFSPPAAGSTTLGDNWVVWRPGAGLAPGASVVFKLLGLPPAGLSGSAAGFQVLTQGGPQGRLKSIAAPPALPLPAGPAARVVFEPSGPLALGLLQDSATMQVRVTDLCGASTVTVAMTTVSLAAGAPGNPDYTALFFSTGGTALAGPSLYIPVGRSSSSAQFYYRTSTAGVSSELLMASAVSLSTALVPAARPVSLLPAGAAFTGVSVDTGVATPGLSTVTLAAGASSGAVVGFTPPDLSLRWTVTISTSQADPVRAVFQRSGTGDPGRSVVWTGLDESAAPSRWAAPGSYVVRLCLDGCAVADRSLRVVLSPAAFLFGTVRSTGAYAAVRAYGPGASYGSFAAASATGYFELRGLQNGGLYTVQASTTVSSMGQSVPLSVSSSGVTASAAGVDIGSIPSPPPARLRPALRRPWAAPGELWGSVRLHDAGYVRTALGTLHYSSASMSSDDGARAFGGTSSTWTVLAAPPGVYDAEFSVPGVGLSTRVAGLALAAGTLTDLPLSLGRKAEVSGSVVLPATTTFGAWVSVEARLAGSSVPAAFGGAAVPCASCGPVPDLKSAAYALYGLDPGTWTFTARSPGLLAASSTAYLAQGQALAGLDLALSSAGALSGSLTVRGDTSGLGGNCPGGGPGLCLLAEAWSPATFAAASARVVLSTGPAPAVSTFSIAGLADGEYLLTARLGGYNDARSSASVAGGTGTAALVLTRDDAHLAVALRLPGGPHPVSDFQRAALLLRRPGAAPLVIPDLTAGTTVDFHPSSAVWHSPSLPPGDYLCDAFYGRTGMWAGAGALLTQGATAVLSLDLSAATASLRGQVSWAGGVSFASGSFTVSVSSLPGLAAFSRTSRYCLLGSTVPVSVAALHLELLPVRPRAGVPAVLSGPLYPAPSTGCAALALSDPDGGPNPAHGYVAAIAPDGSFLFSDVPPGQYLLRSNAELDDNPGDGAELAVAAQRVVVSTGSAPVAVRLEAGSGISGAVVLPPQTSVSRGFSVVLRDAAGTALGEAIADTGGTGRAPYLFDRVADGSYLVTVQDLGTPAAYAGAARAVQVAGLALSGIDLPVSMTGALRGRLALETQRPDGTRAFVLLGPGGEVLLPADFRIEAHADPWFPGGFGETAGLDGSGAFTVSGLLPGIYELRFLSGDTAAGAASGGISLAPSRLPGLVVAGGRTTDAGTARLLSGVNLRGRVVDAGGAGIAGVPVAARPSSQQGGGAAAASALSDSSGAFILGGLDPRTRFYDLTAADRGRTAPGDSLVPYQSAALLGVDLSSAPAPVLRLSPAPYSIRGRLAAPAGGPALSWPFGSRGVSAPGALVSLQRYREIPVENPVADAEAQTGPDGDFVLPALATGTYRFFAYAQGYAALARVAVLSGDLDLGTLTLTRAAMLSGSLRQADGSAPSASEVSAAAAVTEDLGEVLFADLAAGPVARGVPAYSVSGLRPGVPYRLLLVDEGGAVQSPPEAQSVVMNSASESRVLDVVYRPTRPLVKAEARRSGAGLRLAFQLSRPLRSRTAADDDLSALLSTMSAGGSLGEVALSADRRWLTAVYTLPVGVSESSFSVRLRGYSSVADPSSLDPANPEFLLLSTAAFFSGVDGFARAQMSNYSGGSLPAGSEAGRLALPGGAFRVEASSSVEVTLQVSAEPLARLGAAAGPLGTRFQPSAYPAPLLRALAAAPPDVRPQSSFYDVSLPAGVNTSLARPVKLTLAYPAGADPSRLNLYWYIAAANLYILQQDVTGAPPVIDAANRTFTVHVNHFSTFVLFETGVAVISGSAFAGGDVEVFNFPNPFDLRDKTVMAIHPAAALTTRGTVIRAALPADAGGAAAIHIYTVAGERVRTLDLGLLDGGAYYYQSWDGRNDQGRDAATGVYLGVLKVGRRTKTFKMALIK